jgi:hypothetical protein
MEQSQNQCKPGHRCRKFRVCLPCARLRQANFADLAQQVLGRKAALYLMRCTPWNNNEAEIKRLKIAIKRRLSADPAIWTIEQGEDKGLLHLNVISPNRSEKKLPGADLYVSGQIANLRQAAAYILKPSQMPSPQSYSGRQFGCFSSVIEALLNNNQIPLIQAAIMEEILLDAYPLPSAYLERQQEIARIHGTPDYYKQIALKHLPKIQAAFAALKGSNKARKID